MQIQWEHLNFILKASTQAWKSLLLWGNSDNQWVTVVITAQRLKKISTYVFGGWWWRCRWWGVLWWRRGLQSRWCLALGWTAGAPACCLPQGKYQLSLENRSKIHTRFICLLHLHHPTHLLFSALSLHEISYLFFVFYLKAYTVWPPLGSSFNSKFFYTNYAFAFVFVDYFLHWSMSEYLAVYLKYKTENRQWQAAVTPSSLYCIDVERTLRTACESSDFISYILTVPDK